MKRFAVAVLFMFTSVQLLHAQSNWVIGKQELIAPSPPFAQCHASTIAAIGPDKLIAAWFAGSREGARDVNIWMAECDRGNWSKPKMVASGEVNDSLRYPTWNPVLFKSNSGQLFLFYKVGPSPQQWWGMVIKSGNDGKTWSKPERLPEGILGPIKNKPLQLKDGSIVSGSSTESAAKWRIHIERSTDDGKTWQKIEVDSSSAFDVIQPAIIEHKDGRLQLLCRSKQGTVVESWSADKGKTWSKLAKTNLVNPNSGIDAVTLQNGQQLIVYNPALPGKEWYNGRGKLNVAVSDNGIDWKDIAVLENGTKEEFSYPAVIQNVNGRVHISYTYDRKNIKHVILMER